MQVCTIHSLCADILRDHQSRSSLPRGFRILDESGQFLFMYTYRKALGLDSLVKGRPHDFFSDVLRMFNLATEELVTPDRLLEWCHAQQQVAEQCAAEAARGKSKTNAQKAADEVELRQEEAIITESYRAYCDLMRERAAEVLGQFADARILPALGRIAQEEKGESAPPPSPAGSAHAGKSASAQLATTEWATHWLRRPMACCFLG